MSVFSFLSKLGRKPDPVAAPPVPLSPTELLEAREATLRQLQQPGELWLHGPDGPKLAVARFPREQGAATDNKLVLGPAGSGRSLMLARLARTAHAAGNQVVILDHTGSNPRNRGALWHLTRTKGGTFTTASEPVQFNPFWFPGLDDQSWRLPTEEEVSTLGQVLVSVLSLTRYAGPANPTHMRELLEVSLGDYFSDMAGTPTLPGFASFLEWLEAQPDRTLPGSVAGKFRQWFAQASQPFRPGGTLGHVLAATPAQLRKLLNSTGRLLHLETGPGAATEADTPGYSMRPWPLAAPEAHQREIILFLHALATWYGDRESRLTFIVNEWHYDILREPLAAYLLNFFQRGPASNHELIAGWHESPSTVFSAENPAAQLVLAQAGTQLLLHNFAARNANDAGERFAVLELRPREEEAFRNLAEREVLVRQPLNRFEVFSTRLAPADLADFMSEEELTRRR